MENLISKYKKILFEDKPKVWVRINWGLSGLVKRKAKNIRMVLRLKTISYVSKSIKQCSSTGRS
jgi:hypothetical protein